MPLTRIKKDEMRLFRMFQRTETHIWAVMETFKRASCPPYEAVSYCWGSGKRDIPMVIGDIIIPITAHLARSLSCMYTVLQPRWLWIDQICIEQADLEEKAEQVACMFQTFGNATRVIVWLGSSNEHIDNFTKDLPGIYSRITDSRNRTVKEADTPEFLNSVYLHSNEPLMQGLYQICQKQWFRRLWIVQEMVLAKQLLLLCGKNVVDWSQLCAVAVYTVTLEVSLSRSGLPTIPLRLCDLHQMRMNSERLNQTGISKSEFAYHASKLVDLVFRQDCTEPADRVYSVIGLLPDDIRKTLVVQYGDQARDHKWIVYKQFQKAMFSRMGDYFFGLLSSTPRPDWIPSWTASLEDVPLLQFPNSRAGISTGSAMVQLCREQCEELTTPISFHNNTDEMRISGTILDTVSDVVRLLPPNLTTHKTWEEVFGNRFWEDFPFIAGRILDCKTICDVRHLSRKDSDSPVGHCPLAIVLAAIQPRLKAQDFDTSTLSALQWTQLIIEYYPRNKAMDFADFKPEYKRGFEVLSQHWPSRSFFKTAGGMIGLGPELIQPGDRICIFLYAQHPSLLRKVPGQEQYRILGQCYINDIMNGEICEVMDLKKDYEVIKII